MAKTFSCTGKNCPIHVGGAVRCTAKNCEHRTPKYDPDEFFHRKRQTNADRIRQSNIERIWNMSDGELAEFLNRVETDGRCGNLRGKHGWLDWLQQEATE